MSLEYEYKTFDDMESLCKFLEKRSSESRGPYDWGVTSVSPFVFQDKLIVLLVRSKKE